MGLDERYAAKPDKGGYAVIDAHGTEVAWLEPGTCMSHEAAAACATDLARAFNWGEELGGDGEPDPVIVAIPEMDAGGSAIWRLVVEKSGENLYGSLPRDPSDASPPSKVLGFIDRLHERFEAGRFHARKSDPDTMA